MASCGPGMRPRCRPARTRVANHGERPRDLHRGSPPWPQLHLARMSEGMQWLPGPDGSCSPASCPASVSNHVSLRGCNHHGPERRHRQGRPHRGDDRPWFPPGRGRFSRRTLGTGSSHASVFLLRLTTQHPTITALEHVRSMLVSLPSCPSHPPELHCSHSLNANPYPRHCPCFPYSHCDFNQPPSRLPDSDDTPFFCQITSPP
jgi:hypothetical protein